MNSDSCAKKKWALVIVESGIPVSVEAFPDEIQARQKEKHVRMNLNLENDETGVFEIDLE